MTYTPPVIAEVYPENLSEWENSLQDVEYIFSHNAIPQYASYRDSGIGEATNKFIDATSYVPYHNDKAGYCALHRYFIISELLALHRLRKSKVRDELIAYNQRMLALTGYAFDRYTQERQSLRSTYFSRRVLILADKYAWLNALIEVSSNTTHPPECRHAIRVQLAALEYYADVVFTEFRSELTDAAYNRSSADNDLRDPRPKRRFRINHARVEEPNNNYGVIAESFSIGNSAKVKVNSLDVIDSGDALVVRTELILPKEEYEIEHRFSTRVISPNQSNTGSDSSVLQSNPVNQHNNRSIDI